MSDELLDRLKQYKARLEEYMEKEEGKLGPPQDPNQSNQDKAHQDFMTNERIYGCRMSLIILYGLFPELKE